MTSKRTDADAWHALTARVRFIAVTLSLVFLAGWVAWFYPFDDLLDGSGTPVGADFTMFYTAGSLAADGDFGQLYQQAEHQQRLQTLFPNLDPGFCLPYRYPPFVAGIASFLAKLPYSSALAVFWTLSALAFAISLLIWRHELSWLREARSKWLLWAIVGWPVMLETMIGGQASLFAVLIGTSTIVLLRRERNALAGACLALAIFKPNVLLLFGVGLIVYRPRLLRGAIPVGLGIVAATVWMGGWSVVSDYVAATSRLATAAWDVETPFWKVHSLANWLELVLPHARLVSTSVGVSAAVAVGLRWRRYRETTWASIALLILINAVFNPYTPIYDLSLLLIAAVTAAQFYFVDVANGGFANGLKRQVPVSLYLVLSIGYFGPHLSQSLAKLTGMQIFPLLLLVIVARLSYDVLHVGKVERVPADLASAV